MDKKLFAKLIESLTEARESARGKRAPSREFHIGETDVRRIRRARGLRELHLIVPDARSKQVRRRIAKQVAALDRASELDAMKWIEAVSEFDTR